MSQLSDHSKPLKLTLTKKQRGAVDFIIGGDHTFLVADTGEGKTAICLHAIDQYCYDSGTITQCIVAAPAAVIDHWPAEAIKWGLNFGHLDVQVAKGTPAERLKVVNNNPPVLVVSLNNLEWLLEQNPKAEMIIVDELTTASGKQTRKLRNKKWREQIRIRVGMTATPVSESFEKLFAMTRVVDCGERLGRSKEGYMNKYFYTTDYKGYKWALKEGSAAQIMNKVDDILYTVKSDKHLTLPPVNEKYEVFTMSDDAKKAYADMKRDMVVEITSDDAVAPNAAVASGKMRQIASGFVIPESGIVHQFDDKRAIAVKQWVDELEGRKGVVLYQFNHQRTQLNLLLKNYNEVYAYGGSDRSAAIVAFKTGNAQILIAQERVLSHGVDGLQHVCSDLLFMQPPWSADTKIQAIGRLHRTGQKNPTNVTTLMAEGSLDYLVEDRQGTKAENMKKFLQHLRQN
jgi:SNF2 family DNA or RNA helicase